MTFFVCGNHQAGCGIGLFLQKFPRTWFARKLGWWNAAVESSADPTPPPSSAGTVTGEGTSASEPTSVVSTEAPNSNGTEHRISLQYRKCSCAKIASLMCLCAYVYHVRQRNSVPHTRSSPGDSDLRPQPIRATLGAPSFAPFMSGVN